MKFIYFSSFLICALAVRHKRVAEPCGTNGDSVRDSTVETTNPNVYIQFTLFCIQVARGDAKHVTFHYVSVQLAAGFLWSQSRALNCGVCLLDAFSIVLIPAVWFQMYHN
jgi:serine protease inhibitor